MSLKIESKKTIVWILSVIAAAMLIYVIYVPKMKQARLLKNQYMRMRSDLTSLYSFIGGEENLKDNVLNMKSELERLEGVFFYETEVPDIIKYINDKASMLKINVHSVNPGDLYLYRNEAGNTLEIAGHMCKCLPLTLILDTRYQTLGVFLQDLESSKGPVFIVDKLEIKKDKSIAPNIWSKIDLNIYLLES